MSNDHIPISNDESKSDGHKSSVLSELLACALYHERHARERLNTFDAKVFKLDRDEKEQLADMHRRYARAIRSVLSAS